MDTIRLILHTLVQRNVNPQIIIYLNLKINNLGVNIILVKKFSGKRGLILDLVQQQGFNRFPNANVFSSLYGNLLQPRLSLKADTGTKCKKQIHRAIAVFENVQYITYLPSLTKFEK